MVNPLPDRTGHRTDGQFNSINGHKETTDSNPIHVGGSLFAEKPAEQDAPVEPSGIPLDVNPPVAVRGESHLISRGDEAGVPC